MIKLAVAAALLTAALRPAYAERPDFTSHLFLPTDSPHFTYELKPDGTKSLVFLDADVPVDPTIKITVDNLVEAYAANALVMQQTVDSMNETSNPGNDAKRDVLDDEKMLADMKSEYLFYDDMIWLTKNAGIGSLGAAAAYAAKLLSQTQGLPHGRLAFALATLTGVAANGYVKVLEEKKASLKNEIELLQLDIDDRFNYMLYASEYGGDTTTDMRPPSCIYKTSCVETKVCVTSGLFGAESCRYRDVCGTEILACQSE
ncbi:MAG TPA: hypothetical protein VE954_43230 [Oligoflexus sp.]|uniref:hypothetical protein n=1 Tax=Oligoflexus sp. TaxID=1971216 RepID=UPI002D75C505|nr:hypothetical protein [Oligoflexus sp.]HYX39958.1 hypothetical protein [Oligoflexus sp.]